LHTKKAHAIIAVAMPGGNIPFEQTILLYILSIWALLWSGLALWHAAKHGQRNWFIVLLVINTFGILDIIYLFRFAKKRMTVAEIKTWFKKTFFTKTQSQ